MKKVNLKDVERVVVEFGSNVELIGKELKKIQSVKCRLKKMKGKSSYEMDMRNVLDREEMLKEARNLLQPREKFVTEYEWEDIEKLSYDEVIKGLKSIQSKKTLSRWLNDRDKDNDEYRKAVKIEGMLLERKKMVNKVDEGLIRKSEISDLIDVLKESGNVSIERVIELLENVIK